MGAHYVTYLRWDVRRDWKRLAGGRSDASLYPYAFGSGWAPFADRVGPGSTLWVIACPRYRSGGRQASYRLPPTVVARLRVKEVRRGSTGRSRRRVKPQDFAWVAVARRAGSRYFPVNNALVPLTEVTFVDAAGHTSRVPREGPPGTRATNPYAHIPQHLQTPRRIRPGDEATLDRYAEQLEAGRVAFLSYARAEVRHRDWTVAELAEALRGEGFAPWLDLESLAQPPAGGERMGDELLGQILDDGLRQAAVLVALTGPLYAARPWTAEEWAGARRYARDGRLHIVQIPVGGRLMEPGVGSELDFTDPADTARRIRELVDRRT